MIKKLLKFLSLFAFLSVIASYFLWQDYQKFLNNPLEQTKYEDIVFEIKKGEGLRAITQKLIDNKLFSKKVNRYYYWFYLRYNRMFRKFKAGEYEFSPQISVIDLTNLFISGKVKQYSVTLPEGWTLKQIKEHLASIEPLSPHKENINFYRQLGIKQENPEGLFFPDTYFYTRGTSASEILKRSYLKMQNVLLKAWQKREKDLPLKTPYEALILSSIVEKETGKSSERNKIAGVFIRRLNKKMRLQSDPTIIYGMGENYDGNIRKRDINEKTAYNTYQINALPPTPIASASEESIKAVMHPDKGKSLYFVANGKGGHVFSDSLIEHNKAVRKYILNK
ncbi:MAG: endolytic transglycosylase MltG [Gammaproteobacteria bacterium]|nr:endolytic transglycosylase MltG [Gammaproteobacteria bacterium]